jgi:hypothetical protein
MDTYDCSHHLAVMQFVIRRLMSVLTMPLNQSALQHLAAAQSTTTTSTTDSSSTNGSSNSDNSSTELPKLLLVTKGAPESVCKACNQTTLPAGYHARYACRHCIVCM